MKKKSLETSLDNHLEKAFGLSFSDLYEREGLIKLNAKFNDYFAEKNREIFDELLALRRSPQDFPDESKSTILIETALVLEDFLVDLFLIDEENNSLKLTNAKFKKLYQVRREFVQRVVAKNTVPSP